MPVVDVDWAQKSFLPSQRLALCDLWRVTCHRGCHMVAEEAELGRPVVSGLADNGL